MTTLYMKPLSCSTCYCPVQPGEQVTQYKERAGAQYRDRACHASYADCQRGLAREELRHARTPSASADGVRRYIVTNRGDR